jgi:two-component system sensor histidine kinase RpfC
VFSISYLIVLMLIPAYVAALLKKLHAAIAQANEANQAKSRFLTRMSHELRTPLNGVIGMSDLLMDSRLGLEQQSFARTIQSSAKILLGIIENVLDFSKIEAGRIAIETVDLDLHRLITDMAHMFKSQARRKGLYLHLHIDPHVPFELRGDPLHVRQILMNLLGNAMKFTDKGGVELRVLPLERPEGDPRVRIRFEIQDTGIGIAARDQERIFESFRQATSATSRLYGGTGLGTAIARELARLMGGDIGLSSEQGKGALFWVELSFETQAAREWTNAPGLADVRALILGRGEAAASLGEILDPWRIGHTSVESSARAFAELLQEKECGQPYSVLLVDAPDLDLDPAQFAAAVRGESLLDETGLVLVDASPVQGSEQYFCDIGFAAVLFAPVDKTLLFNTIHVARSAQEIPENVVSLADHYSKLAASPKQGLHILVAEDNETNRRVLQQILERVGHRVSLVQDGEAALDALASDGTRFDIMILDKNMPLRSGPDVYKAYRFMAPSNPIPGIVLTADATPEALAACKEAGVNAYLTKPVDTLRLLETVAELVKGAEPVPAEPAPEPLRAPKRQEDNKGGILVDEEKLRSLLRLGAGPDFFKELVGGFLRDSQSSIHRITEALEEEDYPVLHQALHALQGSAGELGASRIVVLCKEMRALRTFELGSDRAQSLYQQLVTAYDQTSRKLTEFPATQLEVIT